MSTHNNGADAVLLKLKDNNTAAGLDLGSMTANKQFNSILYTHDRIMLAYSGTLYRIKPGAFGSDDEALDTNMSFSALIKRESCIHSITAFGTSRVPITINNKEILNPIFNCLH